MERIKWMAKWLGSWIVYVILFSVGGMLFPVAPAIMAKVGADEAKYLMLALVVVTLTDSFLVNYVISHSRITGVKLLALMLPLTWGLQSFMTQIETLVFIKAFPDLNTAEVLKMMLNSLLVFLAFIPVSMLLHGKWKKEAPYASASSASPAALPVLKKNWYVYLPVICLTYVALYFAFGFFPISFEATRDYYAAWTASIAGTGLMPLALTQVVRGLLWFACILPLFFILNGSKEKKMVVAGLLMSVLASFQLMYPNGLMPPIVRFGHFVELFGEMLIFGALIGALVVPED